MGIGESLKRGFKNFYNPYGRATRSEFWWYWLLVLILTSFFGVTGGFVSGHGPEQVWVGIIFDAIGVVFGASLVCAQIRRLHDTDRSGWNVCWSFIPFFGGLYVLYLLCLPSTPGPNRYGE